MARSVSTPPGRGASPLQVTPQQFVRPPQQYIVPILTFPLKFNFSETSTNRVRESILL